MKLSTHQSSSSLLLTISCCFLHQIAIAIRAAELITQQSIQSRLIDKCCQVGKDRAVESPKFNCKLSTREALIDKQLARNLLAMTAESMLARNPNFADQCEMVLESCCMSHHRTRNCDSGKQFAKSGATCMDVELSKEATIATESFNDCCMSCSLGILAAKSPAQNETNTRYSNLSARCKLISPLASSLSGQLYEQTYSECCQENLPRLSSALLEPGAPINCDWAGQSNPCSQRCVPAGSLESSGRRRVEHDRCDCFAGYKLAQDGVSCLDVDECKLGQHFCNKQSEVCDNTRGSYRCLARQTSRSLLGSESSENSDGEFASLRLCPLGSRWNPDENRCQPTESVQRSASLFSQPSASLQLLPLGTD